MQEIQVKDCPKPVGHYSQAIVNGGTLYTSGILPIKIKTSEKLSPETSIEEQFKVVLENLSMILDEVSRTKDEVIKTTIYITDGAYWDVVNQMCAEYFKWHRPARSIIPVKELHFGYKIELEAIVAIYSATP